MLPAMAGPPVVSVINYKGGVGKTTLTANIGAELANRGRRILLIDLDPQASLTFSFYRARDWERELADERTILQWFGTVLGVGSPDPIHKYVVTPPRVNEVISRAGPGRLDLISSHLDLIDVDLDFAAELGGSRFQHGSPRYLRLYRALATALEDDYFADYDVILIDCAPNFTMVTRTGIVASQHLLIPAKPDYLSTLGIDYLRKKLSEFVYEYNKVAGQTTTLINPTILGIVFTMIQYVGANPIVMARQYQEEAVKIEAPRFAQTVRENKGLFGTAGEQSLPAVLVPNANDRAQWDLHQLASEFYAKIRI
jgi:chromosome partitioning protein